MPQAALHPPADGLSSCCRAALLCTRLPAFLNEGSSAFGWWGSSWCCGAADQWQQLGSQRVMRTQARSRMPVRLQSLAELLAESLDVRYGQTVSSVDSSSGAQIKLTTSDGTILEADHVVCTVSLGVLKVTILLMHTSRGPLNLSLGWWGSSVDSSSCAKVNGHLRRRCPGGCPCGVHCVTGQA